MMKDTESVMRTTVKRPALTALNAGTDPSAPSSSSSVRVSANASTGT
jgi:hypothetical protein